MSHHEEVPEMRLLSCFSPDQGAVFRLKIPHKFQGSSIYPTFATDLVKNEHHLRWKSVAIVAMKTTKYRG